MWLGYTPDFCQFVGKGWFCAILGATLLVVSFARNLETRSELGLETNFVYAPLLFLLGGSFVAGSICLLPVLIAGEEISSSRAAVARGDFERSLHHLGIAEAWLPILSYQTDVLYQKGWLKLKLKQKDPDTDLVLALTFEEEGASARAAARD